jgi:hypothetical protein
MNLSPQERVLDLMLFDLTSRIRGDDVLPVVGNPTRRAKEPRRAALGQHRREPITLNY